MDISVVIPVYNVQKYLKRCLDSIFNQIFSGKFEVIAVDDGSTDNSLQILRDYNKTEKRLIVLAHDVNKGLSKARSTGMLSASGDYIIHVDSDDWILPNTFQVLYQKCRETNVDVLVYNYLVENKKGELNQANIINSDFETDNKVLIQKYFLGTVVNKIVKRQIIHNMMYSLFSVNSGEDIVYCIELLLRANTFYLLKQPFYVYCQNVDSITRSISPKLMIEGRVKLLKILYNLFDHYKPNEINSKFILYKFEKIVVGYSFQYWIYQSNEEINHNEVLKVFQLFEPINQNQISTIREVLLSKHKSLIKTFLYYGPKYVAYHIINSRTIRMQTNLIQ